MKNKYKRFQWPRVSLQVKVVLFVAIVFIFFAIPFIRYSTLQQKQAQEELIAKNLLVYLEAFRRNVEEYGRDKWGTVEMSVAEVAIPSTKILETEESALNRFLENVFGTQQKQMKYLQELYRKKNIFSPTNLLRESYRYTLAFLDSIEKYPQHYYEGFSPLQDPKNWKTTGVLDELLREYASNRVAGGKLSPTCFTQDGYTAVFEKTYVVSSIRKAAQTWLILSGYRTGTCFFESDTIHELFRHLYDPCRIGTVAILLSIDDFERQQKEIERKSIDLALFLPLKVLFLVWIFVRFLLYKVTLRQGEFLILYTDGITEAKNHRNEEFGEQRFYEAISRCASPHVETMRDRIIEELVNFCEGVPATDDRTMLIVYRVD